MAVEVVDPEVGPGATTGLLPSGSAVTPVEGSGGNGGNAMPVGWGFECFGCFPCFGLGATSGWTAGVLECPPPGVGDPWVGVGFAPAAGDTLIVPDALPRLLPSTDGRAVALSVSVPFDVGKNETLVEVVAPFASFLGWYNVTPPRVTVTVTVVVVAL